jgi:hypothetical protein
LNHRWAAASQAVRRSEFGAVMLAQASATDQPEEGSSSSSVLDPHASLAPELQSPNPFSTSRLSLSIPTAAKFDTAPPVPFELPRAIHVTIMGLHCQNRQSGRFGMR